MRTWNEYKRNLNEEVIKSKWGNSLVKGTKVIPTDKFITNIGLKLSDYLDGAKPNEYIVVSKNTNENNTWSLMELLWNRIAKRSIEDTNNFDKKISNKIKSNWAKIPTKDWTQEKNDKGTYIWVYKKEK